MLHDIRFAVRSLRQQPGFTLIVVLTLALATGATTAIFSVVNTVLLRPLPFASPDRLVEVAEIQQVGGPGPVLFGDLEEFRRQSTMFEGFAGHGSTTKHIESAGGTERLTAITCDRSLFRVLGVEPMAGRTFREDDRGQLVVISARLWRDRFQRSASIVGSTVMLAGQRFDRQQKRTVIDRTPFTVLGVMPDRFQYPYSAATSFPGALPESRTDLWIFDERDAQGGRTYVTGRLKPGVTVAAAAAEMTAIEQRIDVMTPGPFRPLGVQLTPVVDRVVGSIDRALWLLFGAVALVLVAACANVANLLLARMTVRAREVATRAALGAARSQLVRQFLTESVLLALTGGVLGALIAWWGIDVLIAIGSAKIPRAHEVALDWQVFAFLALLCLVTAAVFGLAPALGAARTDVATLTRESGGHATAGRAYGRIRDALVISEVALAFVLALGAALVIAELSRLRNVDTGMVTNNVITFHMTPRVRDAEYFQLEERVRQLPGVEAAGYIQLVPLQNWGWVGELTARNAPPAAGRPTVELRTVTPGYFQALGIPLIAGRGFEPRDFGGNPQTLLINDALARRDFSGVLPIGLETNRGVIIGVVGDVRQVTLDRPAAPELYQLLGGPGGVATDLGLTLLVRGTGARETLVNAVRVAARETNPALAIFNVKTMDQVVDDSLWELNLYRWLIGLFAALALVLVVIGLYGVISYGVAARTREFAIRLALGSDQASLARVVLGRGLVLTAIGVVAGALTAIAIMRVARDLPVNGVGGMWTFAAIGGLLFAIALLASAVPAIRVSGVNPVTALRD